MLWTIVCNFACALATGFHGNVGGGLIHLLLRDCADCVRINLVSVAERYSLSARRNGQRPLET